MTTSTTSQPLRVGIGGPVGSGKTALTLALCQALRDRYGDGTGSVSGGGGTLYDTGADVEAGYGFGEEARTASRQELDELFQRINQAR